MGDVSTEATTNCPSISPTSGKRCVFGVGHEIDYHSSYPETWPVTADEALIDALMAKRTAELKTTSLHDVWMAGYRAGRDPNARMGDCPYPGRGKGEENV